MSEEPAKLDETLDAKPYEPPKRRRLNRRVVLLFGVAALTAAFIAWWFYDGGLALLPASTSTEVNGLRFTFKGRRPSEPSLVNDQEQSNWRPGAVDLEMTAENISGEKLVVFQHYCYRFIVSDGRIERRSRFCGTPLPPWSAPWVLAPRESAPVGTSYLRLCRINVGSEELIMPPGRYKVFAEYLVDRRMVPTPDELKSWNRSHMPEGKIWLGSVRCGPLVIPVRSSTWYLNWAWLADALGGLLAALIVWKAASFARAWAWILSGVLLAACLAFVVLLAAWGWTPWSMVLLPVIGCLAGGVLAAPKASGGLRGRTTGSGSADAG